MSLVEEAEAHCLLQPAAGLASSAEPGLLLISQFLGLGGVDVGSLRLHGGHWCLGFSNLMTPLVTFLLSPTFSVLCRGIRNHEEHW